MSLVKDENYFKSLAKELDSKLSRISALIDKHPSEIGNYHEYVLKDLISNFLPKRFSIKTGFIYLDENNISPQLDLMIIDENESGCILAQYDDFIVTYPESVCCVIEVKTTFDIEDFLKATSLIQQVKKLCVKSPTTKGVFSGLIFGFKGTKLTPKNLNQWYRKQKEFSLVEYPEIILSLKRGIIMKWNVTKDNWGHYFTLGDDDELKWKSLSCFIAIIVKYCDLKAGINRNAFERFAYIKDMMTSAEYLRYKTGLLKN